ncbi:MAG: hypothetical protein J1F68_06240, partial [Clostridiales bacterium]|nr:hypothetical protein [Clostridiales bacterium]
MNKLLNVRVPLFLAVAFILGIYSCYQWYFGNFYLALIVLLLFVCLAMFFAIKQYGVWKITLVMLVFALMGFVFMRLSLCRIEQREVCEMPVTLTGRVCDLNRNRSHNNIYYLEDCTLSNGERLSGRVEVSI